MYQFRVKVRSRTPLWGGDGIEVGTRSPLFLAIRVDDNGESIRLSLKRPAVPDMQKVGLLQPGEAYCLALDGVTAIVAECETDTMTDCCLIAAISDNPLSNTT